MMMMMIYNQKLQMSTWDLGLIFSFYYYDLYIYIYIYIKKKKKFNSLVS